MILFYFEELLTGLFDPGYPCCVRLFNTQSLDRRPTVKFMKEMNSVLNLNLDTISHKFPKNIQTATSLKDHFSFNCQR